MIAALITVCFIVLPFSPYVDTHWPKWFMFHIVGAVAFGAHYGSKYKSWPLGLVGFVTIFSGANIFVNRDSYSEMNRILRIDMSNMSAKAVVAFLLLIFIADNLSLKKCKEILKAYIYICVAHCVYVLVQRLMFGLDRDHATGFLPNVSMGPSMLAMLYPCLWAKSLFKPYEGYLQRSALILFPILIVIEGSSISWAAFIASNFILVLLIYRKIFGYSVAVFFSGILLTVGVSVGKYIDGAWEGFYKISRFTIWPKFLEWWYTNGSLLFGTGTGAFRHLGPNIQSTYNFEMGQWWYWAHNDWLQIIFETGILGFVSALFLWIQCVMRAYKKYDVCLISSLVALAVVGFGNYPLRLAEFCFLVMILVTIPMKHGSISGVDK